MTETSGGRSESARLTQVENDVGALRGEFQTLGNTVKALGDDITSSDRRQEGRHAETIRRQEEFQKEWRAAKEAEQKKKEDLAQSRQIGPLQALQIAGTAAALVGVLMGGFFFLIKAYLDGTTTPAITQLAERQNATTESNIRRDQSMDTMRSEITRLSSGLADIQRIAGDNRATIEEFRDLAAKSADERARLDERLKAEADGRKAADDALRDEMRRGRGKPAG